MWFSGQWPRGDVALDFRFAYPLEFTCFRTSFIANGGTWRRSASSAGSAAEFDSRAVAISDGPAAKGNWDAAVVTRINSRLDGEMKKPLRRKYKRGHGGHLPLLNPNRASKFRQMLSLRLRVFGIVLGLLGLSVAACGQTAKPAKIATIATKTCPLPAKPTDGTCCPPGAVAFASGCQQVGPPTCSALLPEHAAECTPRWCGLPGGCTGTNAKIDSCEAGTWRPDPMVETCEAVWKDTADPGQTLTDLLPPPQIAPTIPAPAPPILRWVEDAAGARAATENEPGCKTGEWPDNQRDGMCRPAGTNLVCPDGFVAAVPPTTATPNPQCLPDPAACPGDGWGIVGAINVIFVSATAAPAGVGTQTAPLQTLQQALDLAKAGQTIALAAGTYAGSVEIGLPVTLHGACPAKVKVSGSIGVKAAIRVFAGTVAMPTVISGIDVGGPEQGIRVEGAYNVDLHHLRVAKTGHEGIRLKGAVATLSDIVIDGVQVEGGLDISDAAAVSANRLRIHDCGDFGLQAGDVGTKITGRDWVVDGIHPAAPVGAFALRVHTGAKATLRGIRVADNHGLDALADVNEDAAAAAGWTGKQAQPYLRLLGADFGNGGPGAGVFADFGGVGASTGGKILLHGCVLHSLFGQSVSSAGGAVDIVGTQITASKPDANGASSGVYASLAGTIRIQASTIDGQSWGVLGLGEPPPTFEMQDVWIGGGTAPGGDRLGACIKLADGAKAKVARAQLVGCSGAGVLTLDSKTGLSLEDFAIASIAPDSATGMAAGIANLGGAVTALRGTISECKSGGIAVLGVGADARGPPTDRNTAVTNLVLDHCGSAEFAGGIVVVESGALQADHVWVRESGGAGVQISGKSARAVLRDVDIAGVLEPAKGTIAGPGLIANAGADVTVQRVSVQGAGIVGVLVSGPATKARLSAVLLGSLNGNPAFGQGMTVGLDVGLGAAVELSGGYLPCNGGLGGRASGKGTVLTVIGARVAGGGDATVRGEGLQATDGAALFVRDSLIEHARGIGVAFVDATGNVDRSVILATQLWSWPAPDGSAHTLSDGVVLWHANGVEIVESVVAGNPRAGFLSFSAHSAAIRHTVIVNNLLGVTAADGELPEIDGSYVAGNANGNRKPSSGLSYPSPPPLVNFDVKPNVPPPQSKKPPGK